MPILKSALKKLRQDKKRTLVNKPYRVRMREAVKKMRLTKTKKALQLAFAALDKAAKRKVIHQNQAARLKSRLNKLVK
ncbi:MAG: 30S ribosomal protein S20 [Patescibacteria group bacterium]